MGRRLFATRESPGGQEIIRPLKASQSVIDPPKKNFGNCFWFAECFVFVDRELDRGGAQTPVNLRHLHGGKQNGREKKNLA